jgi:hypothetical protein
MLQAVQRVGEKLHQKVQSDSNIIANCKNVDLLAVCNLCIQI